MNLFYSDFDKRFLSALTNASTTPRTNQYVSDAQVLREMAEIWVGSGGDSGGLDDEYVGKLRAEIARLEGQGGSMNGKTIAIAAVGFLYAGIILWVVL